MSRRAGVTLIEILIAISLLSLLSGGILVAMHLGLSTMEKTDARLISNRRVVNARKVLESQIAGLIPAASEATAPYAVQAVPAFLQGEVDNMRFVTSYSLQDALRGRPQLVALQVIPGERGQGVMLIVNETPWTGAAQVGELITSRAIVDGALVTRYQPITATAQSFVLADRLKECRFSYLLPRPGSNASGWESSRMVPGPLPVAIRIEMIPLNHTGNDLHAGSITIPVNVNAVPGGIVADNF